MDVACELCGGTNFIKEAGFYYCTECQRQTQDIQEHVFEEQMEFTNVRKTKKISTNKTAHKKAAEQLTSWECYNYILLGLVNELIQLGAHENLKGTVEALWLKYLKVLEVIGKPDQPPKLPAVNSAKDAEIIYGREIKKKPRVRAKGLPSTVCDTTLDGELLKIERKKQKRALVMAEYDDYMNTQQSNTSLLNQSLTSLKSSDVTQKGVESYLQYNRSAYKQFKHIMKKSHLTKHRKDVNSVLKCHKLTQKNFKSTYLHGPEVLSRQRIYAIIYLGLLINKDKIQLGDLLRFVREGHLSYEHVQHFFPEEYTPKSLNLDSFTLGNAPFTHYSIRVITTKMAKLLNVSKYIVTQNIVDLCQRYCKELNLPDEICSFVMHLFSKTLPKMNFTSKSKIIPNYEGRIISFIIFALKVLFGLDGETESCFSHLASKLNNNLVESQTRMFNFNEWLKYIEFRTLIVTETHFPSNYVFDRISNSRLFINFINDYNDKYSIDKDTTLIQTQLLKTLIETIQNSWGSLSGNVEFPHSLTPFHDYLFGLLESNLPQENYLSEMLENNFKNTTLDFLIRTKAYLRAINPNSHVQYIPGGANNKIEFINLKNKDMLRMRRKRREASKHNVTITDKDIEQVCATSSRVPCQHYSELKLKSFQNEHLKTYKMNEIITEKYYQNDVESVDLTCTTNLFVNDDVLSDLDEKIYNPSECYWLNSSDIFSNTKEEFATFINKFPLSFRFVLQECSRITEQTHQDLYIEYNIVELYLCYADSFQKDKAGDQELNKLIEKAIKLW